MSEPRPPAPRPETPPPGSLAPAPGAAVPGAAYPSALAPATVRSSARGVPAVPRRLVPLATPPEPSVGARATVVAARRRDVAAVGPRGETRSQPAPVAATEPRPAQVAASVPTTPEGHGIDAAPPADVTVDTGSASFAAGPGPGPSGAGAAAFLAALALAASAAFSCRHLSPPPRWRPVALASPLERPG